MPATAFKCATTKNFLAHKQAGAGKGNDHNLKDIHYQFVTICL